MPKTYTTAFRDAWASKTRKAVYKIELKRRYWNGSAFVLESSATDINPDEIVQFNPISWKLDTPVKTKILASNVSITFDNKDHVWNPKNISSGKWAPDGTATVGYTPYKSQIVVKYGYELADGTNEFMSIFTGRLQKITTNSHRPEAKVDFIGNEILLQDADAQNVSTTYTNQATSPATGDGSNLTFDTVLKSLWEVSQVRVNAVVKTQGTQYTLTNVDDAETTCKIVFTAGNAPGAGLTVDFNGRQWKRDNSISTLLGLLCDEAGIGAGNRTIEEPLWPAAAQNKTEDSQANWEAYTLITNISTTAIPGSIVPKWIKIDDFTDGNFTSDPAWTANGSGASIDTGRLKIVHASSIGTALSVPFGFSTGTWSFELELSGVAVGSLYFVMNSGAVGTTQNLPQGSGYRILVSAAGTTFSFLRLDSGTQTSLFTASPTTTGNHEYRVHRSSGGVFTFYQDGVVIGSVTDSTHINGSFMFAHSSGTTAAYFDKFYHSLEHDGSGATSSASSVHESQEYDLLAAPSAWGTLDSTHILNDGTATYETNVASAAGGPYDGWTALGSGNIIASALKRYFKMRVTLTRSVNNLSALPTVEVMTANYFSSSITLTSANFKAQTVFAAVQALAGISNCVFGFKGNGDFFFKNRKTGGTVDFTLDQTNAILKVGALDPGWENIANVAQVSYGSGGSTYYAEYNATDAGEASPTSQATYGPRIRALSLDKFVFSNGANVAEAFARKIYEEEFLPKARAQSVEARIIPQMDLLDISYVSFYDHPLKQYVIFGDPLQTGLSSPEPKNVVLPKTLFLAVGVTFDIKAAKSVLDLEEILA